jgi:excinuclease ABC subunit A
MKHQKRVTMKTIHIQGARTHNLKNITLTLPRDALIVITGPSGSGKSSLAFDTLYAEGQRRYVESLSTYARQFLSIMEKPDVDHIEGLSPAISIEQKSTSHNPRSTVGTITEIYDYLRLLFARTGTPYCPTHHNPLSAQSITEITNHILSLPEQTPLAILAPVVRDRKGEHQQLLANLHRQGFVRARINGELYELDKPPKLDKNKKHHIEIIVDRFKIRPDLSQRIADSLGTAVGLSQGLVCLLKLDAPQEPPILFSTQFACPQCDYSIPTLEPRLFSFNNPQGACSQCDGLGVQEFLDLKKIIPDPSLSIAFGAIRGWEAKNTIYMQMLESLGQHYQFSLQIPFERLKKQHQEIILHGSGSEKIDFIFKAPNGKPYTRRFVFDGVFNYFLKRYQSTESQAAREHITQLMAIQKCPQCAGTRLNATARHILFEGLTLPQVTTLTIQKALDFFTPIYLTGAKGKISEKILKEIRLRLQFLNNVGLSYLTLDRSADTLSGGEAQRIRLASQIGAGLVGVMYVLDEPTIGLHPRDNEKLIKTLLDLKNLGNTVIVVEHDEEVIRTADHLVDIGPGAGVHGGEIVAQGTVEAVLQNPKSMTGAYLNGQKSIPIPSQRTPNLSKQQIKIRGASGHNLKNISVDIPIGLMTCITGVSGSGKSTLINDTLYPYAAQQLNDASLPIAPVETIEGIEQFDKVIDIDQSPIGRTPRSNPATYTGLFTIIRDLFAATQEARARGYSVGRFSFNVKGGRCEACEGDGLIKVEMHFLADIYVTCDHCQGKRYNAQTLEVFYKGKNIDQILNMIVEEACLFFEAVPALHKKLQTLMDVGLSYIRLGQSATTLSGGEAQRVKLAKELSKRDTGKTLYILDEPTTGLHFHDIELLLKVLHELRNRGNTIIVIEHNLDVIKTADWVVDLGPEGGFLGGECAATGTPEMVSREEHSKTGYYLKRTLKISSAMGED